MIQAFRFSDDGISHSGRFVRTAKYAAETEAGRFLYAAFGTQLEGARPISGPDSLNVANTSVLPFAGELLALWEGGSAYRLDAETLATLGPKAWRRDLTGMPFSAHPRVEADGTLWNFGVVNGRGGGVMPLSCVPVGTSLKRPANRSGNMTVRWSPVKTPWDGSTSGSPSPRSNKRRKALIAGPSSGALSR